MLGTGKIAQSKGSILMDIFKKQEPKAEVLKGEQKETRCQNYFWMSIKRRRKRSRKMWWW